MRKIVVNRLIELIAEKSRKERRRISYRMISAETGIDKATLTRYARNEVQQFDERIISLLCAYFKCEIGDLLVFEDEPEDNEAPELKNPAALIA